MDQGLQNSEEKGLSTRTVVCPSTGLPSFKVKKALLKAVRRQIPDTKCQKNTCYSKHSNPVFKVDDSASYPKSFPTSPHLE